MVLWIGDGKAGKKEIATHYNSQQHTFPEHIKQRTTTHWNTLSFLNNTLQHTITHEDLKFLTMAAILEQFHILQMQTIHFPEHLNNTLQLTITH